MPAETPRVRVLPDAIANQIAAGEVVERPASVVKELVENALDAGARRIKVEVIGGGQRSLRVTDDGHGMLETDALTALTRHGTSKLVDAADLERMTTLGFRGEALPSIAAVSRFELCTAVEGAEAGTLIRVAGGGRAEVEVAPAVRGTSVGVEDLFFNTPARRKFLKRTTTELAHISDAVVRLGLAHPEVGFKLLAEGRSVLDVPPLAGPDADPHLRLTRLLGKTIADACRPIEDDGLARAVRVRGFLGVPPLSERGARGQYVFVNGRFVRDKTIASAISEAYQGRLPKGRQPVVVLFIELEPSEVDVNVHPQKTEVRFARPGEIYRAVQFSLRRGLAAIGPAPGQDLEARRRGIALAGERTVIAPPAGSASVSAPSSAAAPPALGGGGVARARGYRGHGDRLVGAFASEGKAVGRWISPRQDPPGEAETSPPPRPASGSSPRLEPGPVPDLDSGPRPRAARPDRQVALPMPRVGLTAARSVGVVLARYLVLEAEGAVWLADLVGIAARVRFEADRRASIGPAQALLVPVELDLGRISADRLLAAQGALLEAGLELRVIAGASEAARAGLHAAPAAAAAGVDLVHLVESALEAFEEERSVTAAVQEAIASARARAASTEAAPTEPAEVEPLLEALERCEIRDRAPDGRPLVVALSRPQLGALFGGAR